MKRVKKGFTLIELLVVVAIIAILAAIAIPQYSKYRERAAKATAVSDAKNIANSIEAYYADNQTYPDNITDGNTVTIGGQSFTLSKNNFIAGYYNLSTGYTFNISNSTYNKSITFNSTTGGINDAIWQ